jgi:hypothetical protein
MTREELRAAIQEGELEIARNNAKIVTMAADARADIIADLVTDDEFTRLVRAQAWRRHSPDTPIARDFSDMPDGWPPSVEDPGAYLLGQIRERVDPAIDAFLGPSTTPTAEPHAEATPSVEKLQSIVGRINRDD